MRLLLMAMMLMGATAEISAQKYITDVMTLGAEQGKGTDLRSEYAKKGWTVLNNDLNRKAGGWDVYIAYKTSSDADPWNGYVTDICASNVKVDEFTFEGRTYRRVSTNNGFNGDLNKGAGGADIFIYYTRDRKNLNSYGAGKRVMTELSVTNQSEDGNPATAAISWRNSTKYSGICDVNEDAGGNDIFIHQHFTTQTLKWKEEPGFATDITFNGRSQELVTNNTWDKNPGTLYYRVDGGEWAAAVPRATKVGNYKVEAYLRGISSTNIVFADNSNTISKTVTINPPIVKAENLTGVFNQRDKRVNLSWNVPAIPGYYSDYKWVVYRNGTKLAELSPKEHNYSDKGYTNESNPVYDLYYVSDFWDIGTQRDDTKISVTVSTTRTVPVNDLKVDQQDDRLVFTWTTDAYPEGFGNKFRIYVDDSDTPVTTLTPADMQDTIRWEHRTTDQHTNPQNKVDEETGVPYTEQPLNACDPHTYRIEGVIGNTVLNTYNVNPKAIGEGTRFYSFDASKGLYEGSVKLSWHVDQQGSVITKTYIVERRRAEQESDEWEVLTRLSSSEDYIFYTDGTAMPGVYYDYRVIVEDKCSDGTILNNDVSNIGFAKSTGTVTGRIAYGSTGTAVQGVEVVMNKTSSEGESTDQFHSIYFSDTNGAVTWNYPSKEYAAEKFATGDFSLQMWIFPEAFSESRIADFGNGIALGMTAAGGLTFGNQTFDGIALTQNAYNHIVLTRSGSSLTGYVLTYDDGSSVPNVEKASLTMAGSSLAIDSVKVFSLGHFKGAVDEFRLWTKCLSEDDIMENCDHLLVGDEQQLETYWTFDEGLRTQFFDYSRDGTNYRKHHGQIGSNAQVSVLTPSTLKLKARTDANGSYVIQSIPFTGEGTTYSVIPLYGIHEFNPAKTLVFVGSNALVHTVDFEDVSSFPMRGYIYYAGTNVPAEGIMLYVDGLPVSKDGEFVKTNTKGEYNISVPIGNHFVEARLEGHTMVAGGRFPTAGTFNFDRAVTHDFTDSTLVNFVGRVGGGERNDTLAVGFAESKNNIGVATIRLGLNNESFSLNCQDDHISTATQDRYYESDTISIQSSAVTGTDFESKYIRITTDPTTGEFSAKLPPLRYVVKDIDIPGNPDIDFGVQSDVDLTSPMTTSTDSLLHWDEVVGDSVWHSYTYNVKKVYTYYAQPEISITEKGHPAGAFGLQEKEYTDNQDNEFVISDLWKQDEENGSVSYLLGYPVYDMGTSIEYDIFGFERYVNHDGDEDVTDIVPLSGQEITVTNEMSDDQYVIYRIDDPASTYEVGEIYELKSNDVQLEADGHLIYQWGVGLPNIVNPYTRHFSINLVRKGRTYDPFELDAVVLGSITNGNNFVTKGPDNVDFVLRDPPGSKSKTTLKLGRITRTETYSSQGFYDNSSIVFNNMVGDDMTMAEGVGMMLITGQKVIADVKGGAHLEYNHVGSHEKTITTTYTNAISTGTAYPYVSTKGDVYVGTSTNLLIGTCRNLHIVPQDGGGYALSLDDAISVGSTVETSFMYSQYELQTVMIPKWKDQRDAFMKTAIEVADSTAAIAYRNTGERAVYLTWVKPGDKDYGVSGYLWVTPEDSTKQRVSEIDSVLWCNQQIAKWEEIIRKNEEDKVLSMKDMDGFMNFSLDGANTYTFAERTDTTNVWRSRDNWKVGGIFGADIGWRWFGITRLGCVLTISSENGKAWSDGDGHDEQSYVEYEYTIYDGNRDTDISINQYDSKNPHWSKIFSVFGGQTFNPYHDADSTQYYLPKTQLNAATVQMEQPNLNISVGNQKPSKTATVTDIPAGGEANVTLYCTNMASEHQGKNFFYDFLILEQSNTKGLEILMDGVPINGRSIMLNQSETTQKVITIRQTDPSVLDYEGIKIRFTSQYQPAKIYDEVTLNAHFVPSSSPIDLVINEPVLNIETLTRNEGDLEMKLTNFDRLFKGMTKVGVEYRYEGSTSWVRPDTLTFLVNREDSVKLHDQVLPATGDLRLRFNMKDDNFYPQGNYAFRAYTTTQYGNDEVSVYSDIIAVTKDNIRPRYLTTPTPTNGILRYGDDISIEFNEDIVPGYVGDKNVIVTAKLNGQPVAHDVAKQLHSQGNEQATVNPVFLTGDFSIDGWLKWTEAGSILRLGKELFAVSVDETGHIIITIGNTKIASQDVLPKNEWTYLVTSYKAGAQTLSALALYGNTTLRLATDFFVGDDMMQQIRYSDDNRLYLGDMDGAIHDLSLFNIYRDVFEAAAARNQEKDVYTYGLVNYWPMREGHGTVATDMRHTHDFVVDDTWLLDNVNYAARLDDGKGMEANISTINTDTGDSYAVELWAHVEKGTAGRATIFETAGTEANRLGLYLSSENDWTLRYGEKEKVVASHEDFPNLPTWNHVALNVVRGQTASFYLNGQRTAVIAESDVPSLRGYGLTLGKDMGPSSSIDEVRIWHAALSESRLLSNMYNCIDTSEVAAPGLVAYYPFEKPGTVYGMETMVPTLENMAPQVPYVAMLSPLGSYELTQSTPPLKNAPIESRLIVKPVASERKIVLYPIEDTGITARDLEGTTLNVTVDKIIDMHGNQSLPIRWQVYCQRNTLTWTKDSVNIVKMYGDDYTFDVDIENRSGQTEYYTLYNMPQWLTLVDSERSDKIEPLKTKTLRFQVNPLVAVGNFDVTIGLQGNYEILEPLRVVMKVRGEAPDWAVKPSSYENNMSIVGQIYIGGSLLANSESLLAAFINGQCRGVASPKLMRGAAYVPLTVYGTAYQQINEQPVDLDNGMPITFRLWDATSGITYSNVSITLPDGTAIESLTFSPTQSYGTFNEPVIFRKSDHIEQPLYLNQGWNWLSLGVEPTSTLHSDVFKDVTSWRATLKDHETGVAYCNGTYWSGSLSDVHANTMYKLQLTRLNKSTDIPQPITVVGQPVKADTTPVTIGMDWNWIAFTPLTTMTVDEALAGANPKEGDQVKSQTAFAYYGPYGWEGDLTAMESGKGYLYKSTDPEVKTFVYPAVAQSRQSAQPRNGRSRADRRESVFATVSSSAYPDNMTMVVLLTDDGTPVADAELAAFIDGECRGSAVATGAEDGQLPLYYLLIAGEGRVMELRASVGDRVVKLNTDLRYISDGNVGTPWDPYVIDLNGGTGISDIIGGSMANPSVWYNLQGFAVSTTRPSAPGVYIHNGMKVVIKKNRQR